MPDFNDLVKNLYTSKGRELTEDKLKYINTTYGGGKEEEFIKNFYTTIGEELTDEKFNYIRDSYLKKKSIPTTGTPSSTGTPPISPFVSSSESSADYGAMRKKTEEQQKTTPKPKYDTTDNAPAVQFEQTLKQGVQELKPTLPTMTSKETEDIGKTLMAKVGVGIPADEQPSAEKTQEQNYQIELGNIYEQSRKLQQDIKILKERGDEAGVQALITQYEQLHQQSQDLLKKYPKALEMINQQKYADELYSGKVGAALEFGAQFGNAILEGTQKLLSFAPRTSANITGNKEGAGQYAADAIDEFFNNRKFLVSTEQFQKPDGELNWSRIVPAIGQTAGTMLTLLVLFLLFLFGLSGCL